MCKKIILISLVFILMLNCVPICVLANEDVPENNDILEIQSKAVVLMEKNTGTILYEKNPDEKLSPASITKIMTLILIFDALQEKKISLDDEVITSEYAKSMGGSQVFLETGEKQSVDTLIKCIIIASGNDASVAMAEYVSGSETEFVKRMNERAGELGMSNTHFEDCCGLTESQNHYTTARDVAIMSKELIQKYPQIHNYSTIWMENITHTTDKGTKEFGLSNTNKLLKQYEWTTGLKTGSTSIAKYCVSATAKKNDIELIAVVMAAPDYKIRFSEAIKLFEYGYGKCEIYTDKLKDKEKSVEIIGGKKDKVSCVYEKDYTYLTTESGNISKITKKEKIPKKICAPVKKGTSVGSAVYYLDEKMIGEVKLVVKEDVNKMKYGDYLKKVFGEAVIGIELK